MFNQWVLKIQRMPKLLLGFIVICGVLIGLYFYDPPTTLCQVQVEAVKEKLAKGFFKVDSRGGGYEAGVNSAFEKCLKTNSPGGCFDIFQRFDFLEKQVRTIPSHCHDDPATAFVSKALKKAFRLFAMIGWGEKPPLNKYNKTSWLNKRDLGLYCRMKRHFIRFYGKQSWQQFSMGYVSTLPGASDLSVKTRWDRGLFSYPCRNLY